jgi:hypothetical protein
MLLIEAYVGKILFASCTSHYQNILYSKNKRRSYKIDIIIILVNKRNDTKIF